MYDAQLVRKVAIVSDSICCLPRELVEKYGICVVPIQIMYEGRSYRDGIDISPSEVYSIMRRRDNLPTTSTPSTGDFLSAYRRMSLNAESILCITVTSLQSRTYDTAVVAKDMAKEVIPGTTIQVLDSRAVAGALGFIVLEAARAASRGADLPEATEVAKGMMGKVHFLAVLDTLFYLARSGRVGRAAAWAGSLLDIKPVLGHSPSVGETVAVARPRSKMKAVERMLEIMTEKVGGSKVHAIVNHADEPEEGERLKERIRSRFDCVELYITEFTPGMGVHTGPGLLAIGFWAE